MTPSVRLLVEHPPHQQYLSRCCFTSSGQLEDSTCQLRVLCRTNKNKYQHRCNVFHPAGSWSSSCDATQVAGGILQLLVSQCHHPHRLARHHQSLNYLTDVSLAPAADPVAERQRGAEEHGASQRRGEVEASTHYILMRCQCHNSECSHTVPLITAPSFSSCSS